MSGRFCPSTALRKANASIVGRPASLDAYSTASRSVCKKRRTWLRRVRRSSKVADLGDHPGQHGDARQEQLAFDQPDVGQVVQDTGRSVLIQARLASQRARAAGPGPLVEVVVALWWRYRRCGRNRCGARLHLPPGIVWPGHIDAQDSTPCTTAARPQLGSLRDHTDREPFAPRSPVPR
jgi:hypothetical protein